MITHLGPPTGQKLRKALRRLNIIKRYSKLDFDKGTRTVLQHSGCFVDWLGEMVITWEGKKITERKARLIRITEDMPESAKVRAIAGKYLSRGAQ